MAGGTIGTIIETARGALRDPQAVRDDLALLRYDRLIAQVPLLYVTMIFVALISTVGLNHHAPAWVRFGVPVTMSAISAWRIVVWARRKGKPVSADRARQVLRAMTWISIGMCALCSGWCVLSWQSALPGERPYIAIFMTAGTLSVAYCQSTIRLTAFCNLAIGLLPIVLLLVLTGGPADLSAAASILTASIFLMRMIMHQHQQLVTLLSLQIEMRRLATTDALTGLANRRALYERLETAVANREPLAVTLIDLDGFKPINDVHGHAAGDTLLRRIAERLEMACAGDATAYRLGGDEFALLMPGADEAGARAIVDRALLAIAAPFDIGGPAVWVGASAGWAIAGADTADADALVASADRALYAAKGERGAARLVHAA